MKLDETSGTSAADSSGNSHTGTYTGGYTLNASGPTGVGGKAVDFNGTTGYVTIPHSTAFNITNCTMMCWVWVDTRTVTYRIAFARDIDTGRAFDLWVQTNGAVSFLVGDVISPGGEFAVTSGTSDNVGIGQWKFIAMTFDGTDWKTYINGVLDATVTRGSSQMNSVTANLTIGRRDYPASELYFDGKICQAVMIGSALSGANLLALYTAGA